MIDGKYIFAIGPIVLGVAALFLLGFVIAKCVLGMRKWKKMEQCPVESRKGFILEKQMVPVSQKVVSHKEATMVDEETAIDYQIVFELEGGDTRWFSVPENTFSLLMEGDTGTITFQKDRLIKFERDALEAEQ